LLARLQSGHLFACRAFEIHRKPQHRDEYASDTSRDILGNLPAFLAGKLFHLDVVRFYFGNDHCTGRHSVCDLNGWDWLWVAARTCRAKGSNGHESHEAHDNNLQAEAGSSINLRSKASSVLPVLHPCPILSV
jgi:hypothetical protein